MKALVGVLRVVHGAGTEGPIHLRQHSGRAVALNLEGRCRANSARGCWAGGLGDPRSKMIGLGSFACSDRRGNEQLRNGAAKQKLSRGDLGSGLR